VCHLKCFSVVLVLEIGRVARISIPVTKQQQQKAERVYVTKKKKNVEMLQCFLVLTNLEKDAIPKFVVFCRLVGKVQFSCNITENLGSVFRRFM